MCGDRCILPTQCCVTDQGVGAQCTAGTFCGADGGTCASTSCTTLGLSTCGTRCFNATTSCCADAATSDVSVPVGTGCFAGDFCTGSINGLTFVGE